MIETKQFVKTIDEPNNSPEYKSIPKDTPNKNDNLKTSSVTKLNKYGKSVNAVSLIY